MHLLRRLKPTALEAGGILVGEEVKLHAEVQFAKQ
jgi:hypothetical protein